MITPSGRKVTQAEEGEEERKRKTVFGDSARKSLGPKFYLCSNGYL
jgi:hypothetical protein